jgi:hypothetical protein
LFRGINFNTSGVHAHPVRTDLAQALDLTGLRCSDKRKMMNNILKNTRILAALSSPQRTIQVSFYSLGPHPDPSTTRRTGCPHTVLTAHAMTHTTWSWPRAECGHDALPLQLSRQELHLRLCLTDRVSTYTMAKQTHTHMLRLVTCQVYC